MYYPWWHVPYLTAPMLIAVVSVLHVLVSHYAVGGGLFLAVEVGHAYRTRDRNYLEYLHRHARFFILLTVVFGAISGVGIWWTIGLASPLATEVLIRTFVFGWATEWVFFVVEVTAAFIFYYYWGRLAERTHVVIGWLYAGAAWISLVLITGITAFMLNPGVWALANPSARDFWTAFFNPQFLPQTIARTGGALLLSSLYVYLHASLTIRDARLRDMIAARSARPALLGAILITAGGLAWHYFLPPSAQAALISAAALNIFVALIFALTVAVFFLLYFGPYRNPGWLSPGFAGSLCLFGIAAFTTGEFIREAVRKPFVVYNVVLGNQIFPEDVQKLRNTGYLEGGPWTKTYVKEHYPQAMVDGRIDESRLLKLPHGDRVALGQVLFQYHCNDCHAAGDGYSAVGPLLRGRPRELVRTTVEHLESFFFMPPWAGTHEEAELMTDYLMSINPPRPGGMQVGIEGVSEKLPSPDQPSVGARRGAGGEGGSEVGHTEINIQQPTALTLTLSQRERGVSSLVDQASAAAVPAPFWFVQFFKCLGFTLHMVPMNLWYAGLLVALWLYLRGDPHAQCLAGRLLRQMPVIVALGVNFGVVPLLFVQLAYYKVFYPATILMAWFWLGVIGLLIPAYYGVYAYAWGIRNGPKSLAGWRMAAGWCAAIFFITIGFLMANGLSLMDHVGRWPELWRDHSTAGAALGTALNVGDPTLWFRWLLMFGLALGTTAVWLLVDVFWLSGKTTDEAYRQWALGFARKLYTLGMVWTAAAGAWYVFGTWSADLRATMFQWPLAALTAATAVAPGLPWALMMTANWCSEKRATVAAVAFCQFGVLGVNAVSRQVVQNLNLKGIWDVSAHPVDVQWGPLAMFLIAFVIGLVAVGWMVATVITCKADSSK